MSKKVLNSNIDKLVQELSELYKDYADTTDEPVVIAGVFFAVAMAKMRRELDDEEFEIFLSQFDEVKEIVQEEENMYRMIKLKVDEGNFVDVSLEDEEDPTIH